METFQNLDSLNGQLKKLLSQVKDTEQSEIEVDIKLQIFSILI